MSKKRQVGDWAVIKQDCNAFSGVNPALFSKDPQAAALAATQDFRHVQHPVGSRIKLVHNSRHGRYELLVRVFEMPDGKLAASYGGATRDYKWE